MHETRSGIIHSPSKGQTLIDVLRWRAQEQAGREAFSFLLDGETQEDTLTYGELDRRARALGAQLQALVEPGDRVVLLLPAGLDYPVAFFGCLYAGVVPVPTQSPRIDQGLGPVESIVSMTQAAAALTTTRILSTLEPALAHTQALQRLKWVLTDALQDGMETEWREPKIAGDSLSHMVLTSGSTATPKAIVVSHDNHMRNLASSQSSLELTSANRLISWMPPHAGFALAVTIVVPVYEGLPVTSMAPSAFLERPLRWLQAMSRTRATHTIGANFAYDLCVNTSTPEERTQLHLETWDVAMSGGELMRPETVERFTAAFAPCGFRREAFYQAYGMSEYGMIGAGRKGVAPLTRTFQSAALEQKHAIPVADGAEGSLILTSCGRPVAPEHLAVVDVASLTRCEPGRVGELWLSRSGNGLGHSYWNNPEETERTFNAYLAETGEGPFLRTGDLGFLHEGEVFLVGRLKELIIIRGRNLSPQQIELTVQQSHAALHSGTTAAFSVDVDDEERLVVVQEINGEVQNIPEVIAAIRHAIAKQHEIQAYAVVMVPPGGIPRTASGKVQRQPCRSAFLEDRLEVIERDILQGSVRPALESSYVPPRSPTEQTLARIWAQVLHVEQVGIHDNFFELGGDSLTSMQVIARAMQAGLHFTIEQLVKHQTIAELAAVVGKATIIEAEQGLVTGPSPLLPTQQRFFEKQDPDYYHIGFYRTFMARRHLDVYLLAQALQHTLAHHDALRMRFVREETGWRQVNLESEEHHVFSYISISRMSRQQQEGAVKAAAEQLHYTLDLATGPLVRMTFFDLGPDQPSVVAGVWHHLVFDAVSQRIIFEDLETAYLQLSRGEAVKLPPKTLSLKAWAERLVAYAQSPELRNELAYWLAEPRRSVSPLPVEPHSTGRGGGQAVWLSEEETKALVYDVPRVYGTEINDVLLTALVRAFAEWTESRSLLIDLVSHGRDPIFPDVDVSRTVGWLATFFPVLLDLGEVCDPGAELRSIKEQLRQIPTRGLGYGVLRYVSQDPEVVSALRSLPKPQVRFNYAGTFDQVFSDSALFSGDRPFAPLIPPPDQEPVAFGDEGEEPTMLVSGSITYGRLRIVMQSGKVIRDPSTMARLIRNYVGALRGIIASCRSTVPVG